jgi:hypothetical protein
MVCVPQCVGELLGTKPMTVKLRTAVTLLACGGIIAAMFGFGLPHASADPTEQQIVDISIRDAPQACATLANAPDDRGVRGAIANVQDKVGVPRWAAERAVGLAVQASCPQYLPLVQHVVPNFP